jgi:V8-like Glu-specific endopeptidase
MKSVNFKCLKFLPQRRFLAATILSIGSCLGAIATTLQPAPAAVMGQDDRVTAPYEWLTSLGQPQAAVGLLWGQEASGGYYNCTFTVIGRNIGLTNAHCVYDEQGRPPQQLKGYLGLYGNRYVAAANVDYYWIGIDTPPKTLEERVGDWAIVRFTSNLGDTTGWFGTATWNPNDINTAGQSVVNSTANYIGYPNDWPTDAAMQQGDIRGYTPAAHVGCTIIDNYIGLLTIAMLRLELLVLLYLL